MKINIHIKSLICLLALSSASCEKELEISPISNIGADSFFQTRVLI